MMKHIAAVVMLSAASGVSLASLSPATKERKATNDSA